MRNWMYVLALVLAANRAGAQACYNDDKDVLCPIVVNLDNGPWADLLLWRDLNHDAISQSAELTAVTASALVGISLVSHWTGRRDDGGNVFRYESRIWVGRGIGETVPRPVYDVFFVSAGPGL